MKRFPFLDWTRGLAIVFMIQSHTFHSFVRPDARDTGAYVLSQFVGGMAAPLFLFMAGMTLAFQMDRLEQRGATPRRRWLASMRRGAYVLGIAYLIRLSNYAASLGRGDRREILKVDILNAMGVAMMAWAVAALFGANGRIRFAAAGGLAIAAASPLVANLDWSHAPLLLRDYLAPGPGGGRFPFFPYASYVGFGLAAGTIVKRTAGLERLMQWSALAGFALVLSGQYFSNTSISIYTSSEFWTNSPALIVIRVGISLLLLGGAYVWTEYCAGPGWSWMQCLGRNALMVYWVHLMLVYGSLSKGLQGALSIQWTAVATLAILAMMAALSAAWLRFEKRRAAIRGARRPLG